MATKRTAPKSLKPVETTEAAQFDEALPAIEAAIQQVVDTFGVTVQRARLKGIRALAYQALLESIEAGDLEALTHRAIANAGSLPNGWMVTPSKRAPKPARKPRASKGSTVATEEGVVIAEQRHVDASVPVVHNADPNKANGCTCGQSYGSKAALSRHLNVAAKA
ncbi:hypothetical protein [Microbacterium sp. NPDC091676]|uniref:hypothetical protein n=1 Tax=Microbacterium sp. NPDC091676 TaxID=3364212 RepID=UPI00382240DF